MIVKWFRKNSFYSDFSYNSTEDLSINDPSLNMQAFGYSHSMSDDGKTLMVGYRISKIMMNINTGGSSL